MIGVGELGKRREALTCVGMPDRRKVEGEEVESIEDAGSVSITEDR